MTQLNVYFNPYPGKANNNDSGKECLLSTALACRKISKEFNLSFLNGEKDDSIRAFTLVADEYGGQLKPSNLIKEYSGKDKAVVLWFHRMLDRGGVVKAQDLSLYETLILENIGVQAPMLEYALRNEGMAITLTDDDDWRINFFNFIDNPEKLPNIYGQTDCSDLYIWIREWLKNNLSFQQFLEQELNVIFCDGATNTCSPLKSEEHGIITALKQAQKTSFQVDNDLIKRFSTKKGDLFELRSYGDGVRIFFVLESGKPIVGGFYRKTMAMNQNKVAKNAADRLKKQGYIK